MPPCPRSTSALATSSTVGTTSILERLTIDAGGARVVEGLGEDKRKSPLDTVLKELRPRWFVVRDARGDAPTLLNPCWAMSYLRGPMTSVEIRHERASRAQDDGDHVLGSARRRIPSIRGTYASEPISPP